jgi:FkbM family methyltransferase
MENILIISNSCVGLLCHKKLTSGEKYNTPMIGTLILNDNEYIKLCNDPLYYMNLVPLCDQIPKDNTIRPSIKIPYPVIHLGDIDIQCIHETNNQIVLEKFMRRQQRFIEKVKTDNYIVICLLSYSELFMDHRDIQSTIDEFYLNQSDKIIKIFAGPAQYKRPTYKHYIVCDFFNDVPYDQPRMGDIFTSYINNLVLTQKGVTIYTNNLPIPFDTLRKYMNHPVNGVIHIGAHNCEEEKDYQILGIGRNKTIWIDAIPDKVKLGHSRGYNIYHGVISDQDDQDVVFHVANNGQSSSMLELGTHRTHYNCIHYVQELQLKTVTIPTLVVRNNLDITGYNFVNLDIQGSELVALKGMESLLRTQIDYVYSEINIEHLYMGGALVEEIDTYLKQFGFKRVITHMTQFKWGDAFYIKQ